MTIRSNISPPGKLPINLSTMPRPLVFTNGVFDLLHPGHVTYLEEARALGAALLVGLNSDTSARMLGKGPDRPICNQADRAIMVAALASVDCVCLFDEQTPLALIETVRPDIYVKGGDYNIDALAEASLVRSWGGSAKSLKFLQGYSTTRLVARIQSMDA